MTDTALTTPPCVFCGEPTHLFVRNDNGCYVAAVMCIHCDNAIQMGTDLEDVKRRAVDAYERATTVRDRLLTACQRLLDAEATSDELPEDTPPVAVDYMALVEATELARTAVRDFTLSGERRKTR